MREFRESTISELEKNLKTITELAEKKLANFELNLEDIFKTISRQEALELDIRTKDLELEQLRETIRGLEENINEISVEKKCLRTREEELLDLNLILVEEKKALEKKLSEIENVHQTKLQPILKELQMKEQHIVELELSIKESSLDKELLGSLIKQGKAGGDLQGRLLKYFQGKKN